jgi:hypothetical protein
MQLKCHTQPSGTSLQINPYLTPALWGYVSPGSDISTTVEIPTVSDGWEAIDHRRYEALVKGARIPD